MFETEDKIEDPDAIYVADESTTYFLNELNEETIYEKDGKIIPSDASYEEKKDAYSYPKISGLKNKEIENKINEEIRNKLIDVINSEGVLADAYINASFSNILSVRIQRHGRWDGLNYYLGGYNGLNYDLNTGNKIQFEDLFVKSAPIKLIFANSLGRTNAWRSVSNDLEEWKRENGQTYNKELQRKQTELSNMDNRDFSQNDDFILKACNAYDSIKGNIDFGISPFGITIYNDFPTALENGTVCPTINIYEYYQYFTIFKKYSGSGKSIYETTNTMQENIRATYKPVNYNYKKNDKNIVCEDLTDNLFADIAITYYADDDNNILKAIDISKTNVNNVINDAKLTAQQDKSHGYVLQGELYGYKYEYSYSKDYELQKYLKPYIEITFAYNITKFDKDKYKNYYFGKLSSTYGTRFNGYLVEDIPGISASDNTVKWYFDEDGNYVGTDKNLLIDYEREEMYYNPS